ncbi:MAG TPA: hypothetical protein PLX95_01580 [bacterium]|nr:hypothetical protein [bacterium]
MSRDVCDTGKIEEMGTSNDPKLRKRVKLLMVIFGLGALAYILFVAFVFYIK